MGALGERTRLKRSVASCLVLTLTFLSFVVEVHGHLAPDSVRAERSDDYGQGKGGGPSSICPICQLVASGTTPLVPSAHVLLVLNVVSSDVVRVERTLPIRTIATSYDWESRAPPLS